MTDKTLGNFKITTQIDRGGVGETSLADEGLPLYPKTTLRFLSGVFNFDYMGMVREKVYFFLFNKDFETPRIYLETGS